jgi:hypothetical protein
MNRSLLALILLVFACINLSAQQNPKHCLSDQLQEILRATMPERLEREQSINNQVYQQMLHSNVERGGERVIPIVVHIIHQNGEENISDEAVLQGIQDLNEAFSNTGNYQNSNGVNTGIQFCLAQQDPNGMPTTGITRHVSQYTELTSETEDDDLKNIVRWNPLKYLNIWLVKEISSISTGNSVAGYAYFPSSHGSPEDGIVNEARWFGSSIDNSKVHIHEAGHYLGLYHTFNGGCQNNNCLQNGDFVCDTPPDASSDPVACNSVANTCHTDSDDPSNQNPFRAVALGGSGDSPDLFINYMDYGFQICQNSVTQGQSDRMNAMLSGARSSLLESQGCNNACGVNATGTSFQDFTMTIAMAFNIVGFSQSIVPHHFEWRINGVVADTDSILYFNPSTPGIYTLNFRIYNTELNCYSEKTIVMTVKCGTQQTPPTFTPLNPAPGQVVNFNSNIAWNTTAQWLVNDVPVSSLANFTHTFATAGEYQVQLITSNLICSDTSAILFVPVGTCNAGENLKWWFGGGTVLSFYGQNPVRNYLGTSPSMFPQEGVSSICDQNGELLLFSNGVSAHNRFGSLIDNGDGLLAGSSSTQGALIIPNPSGNSLYYIFTTDHFGGQWLPTGGGLSYSIADMSLFGGTGGITEKNVMLMQPTGERQAAVKHCNGHDIWHVSHEYGSNRFYAYLVTDEGVNPSPVISSVGTVNGNIGDTGGHALGSMKISPQGDKLALTTHASSTGQSTYSELYDFDVATGIVSNPVYIVADTYHYPYGVEFSPDGSKLYISNSSSEYIQAHIYQFDLSSNNPSEIIASRQLVGVSSTQGNGNGALQVAKNGSIYSARNGEGFLDEIRHPNLAGTACMFVDKAIEVAFQGYGLPNQVSSFSADLTPNIQGPAYLCSMANADYTLNCGHLGNTSWSFEGPGTLQVIDANRVTVQANAAGIGKLIVSRDAGCEGLLYDTLMINIGELDPFIGNDTLICQSAELRLSPGTGYSSYLWEDGSTMSYHEISGAGTYWVRVNGAGNCLLIDTIVVNEFPENFSIDLGENAYYCNGSSVVIEAPEGDFTSYLWSTGSTDSSVEVAGYMTLKLSVTNVTGCIASDSIQVSQDTNYPYFDFPEVKYLCPGQVLLLETGHPEFRHLWQDLSDLNQFTAFQPGLYWATVTSPCGNQWRDSVRVLIGENPIVNLGKDTVICPFAPYTLNASGPFSAYLWQNGSTMPTFTAMNSGIYSVSVTNSFGCTASDSVEVEICPSSTGNLNADKDVFIYPNPSSGYFTLFTNLKGNYAVEIFNAAGALVFTETMVLSGSESSQKIEYGKLAAGIYSIKIITESICVVKSLMVE